MLRVVCAFALILLIASPSFGQQSLIGTYKMVSNALNIDGTLTENMGKTPKGYLAVTPTRVVFFFTAEHRKFGTSVADKAALFDTLTAWSGVYRIDGKKLVIRVDALWVEHWNGTDQTRNWELSGNRLTITADPFPYPRDPSKKVIPQQVWEKVE
jgi:hypothetical protein